MPATFFVGDAIEVMSKLPENSVDLVLSSPPFWKLRSYLPADHELKAVEGGSEDTPGEFIDWLIDVAEACDRVLAPHGSMAFELGDTYSNGDGGGPRAKSLTLIPEMFRFSLVYGFNPLTGRKTEPWILRNVIRWVRPNPPVGALGDKFRPATSELMVFCKSAKRYFDLDAVREPHKAEDRPIVQRGEFHQRNTRSRADDGAIRGPQHAAGAPPLDWWNIPLLEGEEETRYGPKPEKPYDRPNLRGHGSRRDGDAPPGQRRNMSDHTTNAFGAPPLDWWEIPPGGYNGAHYAVMPAELCVKPVKAMCPEKVCRACGEPSRRIVEQTPEYAEFRQRVASGAKHPSAYDNVPGRGVSGLVGTAKDKGDQPARDPNKWTTLGFSDCGHDDWRPGMVLDPFGGSGTTALVATGHGRDCILIDLDSRNFDLALDRVGPFILTPGST